MRRTVPLERLPGAWREERGLGNIEAAERLRRFGPNHVIEIATGRGWALARDTARDPMIWFLVVTGSIYGGLAEWTEALTLLGSIAPLVGMDAYLHRRVAASTAGLSSRLAERGRLLRDGEVVEVAAAEVVPGDLAVVGPGEWFPADGILIGGDVQVDESVLTGESYPARKHPCPRLVGGGPEPAVEGEHWGLAGTRLLTGNARLRVVFTAGDTLYGEIARSALVGSRERTPLQVAIGRLVSFLMVAAVGFCVILAVVRWQQGHGWLDAVLSALTLGVAAFPEEFPVVFTFFLGVGVYRLARRQALVRRAVSVENVGRVSIILSDKTGTITEGRLGLAHVVPSAEIAPDRALRLAAMASRDDSGDPLDEAIFAAAGKAQPLERLASFPFTEGRRRETTAARDRDGSALCVTKGTTELVLSMCALDRAASDRWSRQAAELAADGHKVIACAWQPLDLALWKGAEPQAGYRFAAILAFEDPIRDGVREAVASCARAGIRVIMVTGDHPATASAVARDIGLAADPVVISGDEMSERLAGGGAQALRDVHVIARAVPAQKHELVKALQASGESVAVTGDGVNDVPALQAADVGIAMGERGTRSAREVSAIVLLDDNLRTIVAAVFEGRQLFNDLRLSFQYLLMIHIPLVLSAALVPLAGYPLLYLPVHIVWLELIIHPTAILAFQGVPVPVANQRPSGHAGRDFFTAREWAAIVVVGALVTSAVIATYAHGLGPSGQSVAPARSLAMLTLTFSSAAVTAASSHLLGAASAAVFSVTVVTSAVLVQVPVLASLLHLAPLPVDDWLRTIGAAGTIGVVCRAFSRTARGGRAKA